MQHKHWCKGTYSCILIRIKFFITPVYCMVCRIKTQVGKSKFSPYYFYTDTNKYLFEISRYELSKLVTFDRLTYKGSYLDNRAMTKEDLENIKDNRNDIIFYYSYKRHLLNTRKSNLRIYFNF